MLYPEFDAGVPKMKGYGDLLKKHSAEKASKANATAIAEGVGAEEADKIGAAAAKTVFRLPACDEKTNSRTKAALEAKNRRLMGLLIGIGEEHENKQIHADEVGPGPTHGTHAVLLLGRVVVSKIVNFHNSTNLMKGGGLAEISEKDFVKINENSSVELRRH